MMETLEQRSRIMRAVKGTDTEPELIVRHMVHQMGYHFGYTARIFLASQILFSLGCAKWCSCMDAFGTGTIALGMRGRQRRMPNIGARRLSATAFVMRRASRSSRFTVGARP